LIPTSRAIDAFGVKIVPPPDTSRTASTPYDFTYCRAALQTALAVA
jgi:hypothetical protein